MPTNVLPSHRHPSSIPLTRPPRPPLDPVTLEHPHDPPIHPPTHIHSLLEPTTHHHLLEDGTSSSAKKGGRVCLSRNDAEVRLRLSRRPHADDPHTTPNKKERKVKEPPHPHTQNQQPPTSTTPTEPPTNRVDPCLCIHLMEAIQ